MSIKPTSSQQFKNQAEDLRVRIKEEVSRNMVLKTRIKHFIKKDVKARYKLETELYRDSNKQLAVLIETEKQLHSNRIYDPTLGQVTKNLGKRLGLASRGVARIAVGLPLLTVASQIIIPALIGASIMQGISKTDQGKASMKCHWFIDSMWNAVFTGARLDFYRSYATEADGILEKRRAQIHRANQQSDMLASASRFPAFPTIETTRSSLLPPVLPEIHTLGHSVSPRTNQRNEPTSEPVLQNNTGYDASQVRFSRMGLTEQQLPSEYPFEEK